MAVGALCGRSEIWKGAAQNVRHEGRPRALPLAAPIDGRVRAHSFLGTEECVLCLLPRIGREVRTPLANRRRRRQ